MSQLSLTVVTAALVLGTSAAQAQRAIPMPDTLGANFPIGDSARGRASATDFDFLVGQWHFTHQTRRSDGTFNPPISGHWSAFKKAGARYSDGNREGQTVLLEDHWRPDDSTDVSTSGVYTWRSFSSEHPIWGIQGINTWELRGEPGLSWSDGANRYLIQHRESVIVRIRYFAIDGNSFLWRRDSSTDGGRTWLLDSATMKAQRTGR